MMRQSVLSLLITALIAMGAAAPGLCEDLVGTVANGNGQAVGGVKIQVQSSDGAVTQSATTEADGQYVISGLYPGQYFITLDSAGRGVQGQTVAGYLGENGLTVNWSVGSGVSPLASAQPGIHLTSASTLPALNSVAATSTGGSNSQVVNSPSACQKSAKRCSQNCQGNNNCQ